MGRRCETCVRADRSTIDAALAVGSSVAGVAKAYHLNDRSVYRHIQSGHVPGIVKAPPRPIKPTVTVEEVARIRAKSAPQAPVAKAAPVTPTAVEKTPVSLRSPGDVLSALESTFAEALAMLERSKESGDLRTQNSLLNTMVVTLDKLAKSVGLYTDGAVVNVNNGIRRMELAVAKLSDEQLEASLAALARGERVAIEGEVVG